jgi:hypothetical protein
MKFITHMFMLFAVAAAAGCGDDGVDPNLPFGETAFVVVVNPAPNEGNTVSPPAFVGAELAGVGVDADPGGSGTTDDTGLAVLRDLDAGDVNLFVGAAAAVPLTIASRGDVYDLAVAYDGSQAGLYTGFPIRYQVGGEIVVIATDADASEALGLDDTIVFFEEGVHAGNLLIEGENVILYGDTLDGEPVVIDGSVEVRGGNVRIRGVTIAGDLTVFGNNFGMSFSVVQGSTQLNGQAISFLRNVFCQGANVPSSNAALYDNEGLPPFATPPAPTCPQ